MSKNLRSLLAAHVSTVRIECFPGCRNGASMSKNKDKWDVYSDKIAHGITSANKSILVILLLKIL